VCFTQPIKTKVERSSWNSKKKTAQKLRNSDKQQFSLSLIKVLHRLRFIFVSALFPPLFKCYLHIAWQLNPLINPLRVSYSKKRHLKRTLQSVWVTKRKKTSGRKWDTKEEKVAAGERKSNDELRLELFQFFEWLFGFSPRTALEK